MQVNQLGTVTEAIEVVKMAKDAKWGVVISQRSGETDDSFLADLSVGLATGQIKAGAPCRGERLAKYNQVCYIYIFCVFYTLEYLSLSCPRLKDMFIHMKIVRHFKNLFNK